MAAKYLIRIDDVCPTMDWAVFEQLEAILTTHSIRPIIGIIPDNQDTKLAIFPSREDFWPVMQTLMKKGWIVAQHGHQHMYVNQNSGILGINHQSEFSGLPYEEQKEKIQRGKEILEQKLGLPVRWWMAPAHSFDKETCRSLQELGFEYVTDGIALFPFQKYGLTWIPQQLWQPKKKFFGTWTICLHPNSMTPEAIAKLKDFIGRHTASFMVNTTDFKTTPYNFLPNTIYRIWWQFQYVIYKTLFK